MKSYLLILGVLATMLGLLLAVMGSGMETLAGVGLLGVGTVGLAGGAVLERMGPKNGR